MSKVTELIEKIRQEYLSEIEELTNKTTENKSEIENLKSMLKTDNIDSVRTTLSEISPDIDFTDLSETQLLQEIQKMQDSEDITIENISKLEENKAEIEEFINNKDTIISENEKTNNQISDLEKQNSTLYYQIYTIQSERMIGLEKSVNDIAVEKINDASDKEIDSYIKDTLENGTPEEIDAIKDLTKKEIRTKLISEFSDKSKVKVKETNVKEYKEEQIKGLKDDIQELFSKQNKKENLENYIDRNSKFDISEVETYLEELEQMTKDFQQFNTTSRKESNEICTNLSNQISNLQDQLNNFPKKKFLENGKQYEERKNELKNKIDTLKTEHQEESNNYNNEYQSKYNELKDKAEKAAQTVGPLYADSNNPSQILEQIQRYRNNDLEELKKLPLRKEEVAILDVEIQKLESSISEKAIALGINEKQINQIKTDPHRFINYIGSNPEKLDTDHLDNYITNYNDIKHEKTSTEIQEKYDENIAKAVQEDISKKSNDDDFER